MREESIQSPVTAFETNRGSEVLGYEDFSPEPAGSAKAQQRQPRSEGRDETRQEGPTGTNAIGSTLKKGVSRCSGLRPL